MEFFGTFFSFVGDLFTGTFVEVCIKLVIFMAVIAVLRQILDVFSAWAEVKSEKRKVVDDLSER